MRKKTVSTRFCELGSNRTNVTKPKDTSGLRTIQPTPLYLHEVQKLSSSGASGMSVNVEMKMNKQFEIFFIESLHLPSPAYLFNSSSKSRSLHWKNKK
jgi:hypothetical protein